MKILFVDDRSTDFERFLELPFGQEHRSDIEFRNNPVGLPKVVEDNLDLRLIILDMLWEQTDNALQLGAEAMRDLAAHVADVPVVIHSVLENDSFLRELFFEMLRLGAYDWISKDEPRAIRSLRFERAYQSGRDAFKRPSSRAILSPDEQYRPNVHVAALFVDLSGFTALTDIVPVKNVTDVLRSFYQLVGREVSSRKGYIYQHVGDAVVAVFGASGSAKAHTDANAYLHVYSCIQAARAIQAASATFRLEVVEPLLQHHNLQLSSAEAARVGRFRMAVESGPTDIVRFERGNESELTFVGTPINIAARIIDKAEPGQIWIGGNAYTGGLHGQIEEEKDETYKNLQGNFKKYLVQF